ncbi:hypothetical protein BH11BAC4_BH11BAC4_00980 [soil metagenome]
MLKKYFPLIALLAAAALFFWVKKNQRGGPVRIPVNIEQPATPVAAADPFDRNTGEIVYSKHAKCRMDCRHIDESEVKEILQKGEINYSKIEESPQGRSYPLEGVTHDRQHVRIVFAPHEKEIVVVTVIDLDTEWKCNCN